MRLLAILFDLDDTLIREADCLEAALLATAQPARSSHGVDPSELARALRREAHDLWFAHPLHAYARRIGVSSWEALWARFEGRRREITAFREWAPRYRREAWSRALAGLGVRDESLGRELAERFPRERRARHEPFPETIPVLTRLRAAETFRLGLVTNGLSCLQREKLRGAGLESYFDAVCVAGDVGVGKPDPKSCLTVLDELGVSPDRALFVGNHPAKDVAAARAAGIFSVLVERNTAATGEIEPDARIRDLGELPALLEGVSSPSGEAPLREPGSVPESIRRTKRPGTPE